jgi:hypothetical protein
MKLQESSPGVTFLKNWRMSRYFPAALNLFNRVQFGYPGVTQGTSNFGVVTTQLNLPRLLQFSLRVNF